MITLFVNAPAVWESESRRLGYSPLTEWFLPDHELMKLGYIEPLQSVANQYKQAAANGKYVLIVHQDGGDHFAIFTR